MAEKVKRRKKLKVKADRNRGLYRKFEVTRTDGSSEPGGKHHGCDYFVLDLTHDKFAPLAILHYAMACEAEYPALAADLRERAIKQLERNKGKPNAR